MLITLLSLLLKTLGILFAIPGACKQYKSWRAKEIANLYQYQSVYARTGNKPRISWIKRILFRLIKMPMKHLYGK